MAVILKKVQMQKVFQNGCAYRNVFQCRFRPLYFTGNWHFSGGMVRSHLLLIGLVILLTYAVGLGAFMSNTVGIQFGFD